MNWIEEMKMGMLMIQSACQKNGSWNDCQLCPFTDYCDACLNSFGWPKGEPSEWNLEEEKEM